MWAAERVLVRTGQRRFVDPKLAGLWGDSGRFEDKVRTFGSMTFPTREVVTASYSMTLDLEGPSVLSRAS